MTTGSGLDPGGQGTRPFDALKLPKFAPKDPGRPFIVAIEGPNGAGKSTLCERLSRDIPAPSCLGTDPAWFSEAFKVRMIRDADWYASAMFFLSGCCEQMRLLQGRPERVIILDRSLWSTLAVHAAESTVRLEALLAMLAPVAGQIQIPDFTLVLQARFVTCQERIAHKFGAARILDELTAAPAFHERERAFYTWLGGHLASLQFLGVDELTADAVASRAQTLIQGVISC